MKKDKTIKKYSKAEISSSAVCEAFGSGGVIFSDIRIEYPILSDCRCAEGINEFYSRLATRLREYAEGHLRELGEREFAALGEGVARFRFRRYSLVQSFRVTHSDERCFSILRTVRLTRGSLLISERTYGEVFDTFRGRFMPPERFVSRRSMKKAFSALPKVRLTTDSKSNFYTDGKKVVFLLPEERRIVCGAETL